jgi:hypothetical protein
MVQGLFWRGIRFLSWQRNSRFWLNPMTHHHMYNITTTILWWTVPSTLYHISLRIKSILILMLLSIPRSNNW